MMENGRLLRTVLFALIMLVAIYVSHQILFLGWTGGDSYSASWLTWIEIFLPILLACIFVGAYLQSLAEQLWLSLVGGAVHQAYMHYAGNGYEPPMLEFLADTDPNVAWTSGLTAAMLVTFIFLGVGVVIGKITGMRER
jgi:hypothetical protein